MSTKNKNSEQEVKIDRKRVDSFEPKLNTSIWYN
jgi:hypothetical protein